MENPSDTSSIPLQLMNKTTKDSATVTDVCSGGDLSEVELIYLVQEQIPAYRLRADTLTQFAGYENEDWFIPSPALKAEESNFEITAEQAKETYDYFLLCSNRVSQMTKTYNDIEAVTRLLEEKEKDLELAARIGKNLLTRNKSLEERVACLEADLATTNETLTQLKHDLALKTELLQIYTNDCDESGSEGSTPRGIQFLNLDLLQRRIVSLEEEKKDLMAEATQLAKDTEDTEDKEQHLIESVLSQLDESKKQVEYFYDELGKKSDDSYRQQEEITSLLSQVVDLQMKYKKVNAEKEELSVMLQVARECQNELAFELSDFKDKYKEALDMLHDSQDELKRSRRKSMPHAKSLFVSGSSSPFLPPSCGYNPDSLASELELSKYPSMEDHKRINEKRSHLSKVFETVRSTSRTTSQLICDSSPRVHTPDPMLSSTSNAPLYTSSYQAPLSSVHSKMDDMSSSGYLSQSSGHPSMESNNSDSEWSTTTDTDDFYPLSRSYGDGSSNDLASTLRHLTPTDIAARRARLSYGTCDGGVYDSSNVPFGCRTPDSIMSTGSNFRGRGQWRLPEMLKIVKPMEGSQTLQHWSHLATPHLGGLLEERSGVQIKGGCDLDVLGVHEYTLSDIEEDDNPGKSFQHTSSVYTYTNSTVLHPDDHTQVTSSLHGLQMSALPSACPSSFRCSAATTPNLSRRNSCTTFSTSLGLAALLHERGIKGITPSAMATPATEKSFTPTATPCNSPRGSPPGTPTHEQASSFGGFFSVYDTVRLGAKLLRRTLGGEEIETPTCSPYHKLRNTQSKTTQFNTTDPKCVSNINLMERLHHYGIDNIMVPSTSLTPLSFQSPIYSKRIMKSPMAQLTNLKTFAVASEGRKFDSKSAETTPSRSRSIRRPTSALGRPDLGTVRQQRTNSENNNKVTSDDRIGTLLCGRKGGLL